MADSTLMDVMKIAIPSILTLAGTGIAGYFAYLKWHVERRDTESSVYQKERRAAYQKLWTSLEEAHAVFNPDFDRSAIAAQLEKVEQNVKAYFLDQSIYVDEDDRDLILSYLQYLGDVRFIGRDPGAMPDPKAFRRGEVPHAHDVVHRAMALNRKKLIAKIRHVLGGQG